MGNFELKIGLIHLLPALYSPIGEDLHKHLKEFHMCVMAYVLTVLQGSS